MHNDNSALPKPYGDDHEPCNLTAKPYRKLPGVPHVPSTEASMKRIADSIDMLVKFYINPVVSIDPAFDNEVVIGHINSDEEVTKMVDVNRLTYAVHKLLEQKTGWGRNEIKNLLEEAVGMCTND